ncbi:hypothetical protein RDWZM_006893 [Blomia tropicalis]|uniref:Uncharacterized protein n=1 Tax=Blomia tropicalis TaxID=40697 RepID=A0A9Q0RPQ5_BLOTA|nr:hypothetical protein RDWZM_006893 [Blomia tropicalis]
MRKLVQIIWATFAIVVIASYGAFGKFNYNNVFFARIGKTLYLVDDRISDLPISLNIPNYNKEFNKNILKNRSYVGHNYGQPQRNIESNSNLKKIMLKNVVLHNLHTSMIVLPYEFKYVDNDNNTKYLVNYATNKTYLTSDIVIDLASTSYQMKVKIDMPVMFNFKIQQPIYYYDGNVFYNVKHITDDIHIQPVFPKKMNIQIERNSMKDCYEFIQSYDEIKNRLMRLDYSFVRNIISQQIKYALNWGNELDEHFDWKIGLMEQAFENRVGTSIEDMDSWISDLPIKVDVPEFTLNYTNQLISKITFKNMVLHNLYTSMIKPYELHYNETLLTKNLFTIQYETNKTYLTSDLTIEFSERLNCFKKTIYDVQLIEEFQLNFHYKIEQPKKMQYDMYYSRNLTLFDPNVEPLKPFNQRIMYTISNIDSRESQCLDENEDKIVQTLQNTQYNATINVIKELLTEKMLTAKVAYWEMVHTVDIYNV